MIALQIDFLKPFKDILDDIVDSLPTVAGFIGYVIFVWIFIKVFLYVVKKILAKTNIDQWSEKLSETEIFGSTTINIVFTKVILGVLKWFLILIFIMGGSEMFGLTTVSDGLKSFFAYLPKLITALSIFVGGAYLGTMVKKAIQTMFKSLEINGGNLVGNIAFYLIVIFLSITALDQAGVDTSVIKSNLTLLIGSVLLAFTIAFGLGARDAISRLLFGYYSRKNIEIGSNIKIGEIEGVVIAIDNICLTLRTNEGLIVVPIKDIVDNKIIVKK
ncbi:mechanosensitive ion channel-like protein [Tenacibaculum adriaticum]|uniref:Mechanosensitive ion channel-like protein n=1 Tax=Tenacibaculum adriaticum TaxID=413713 RepID=A0A5S5DWW6_9FLAO|nr:mechanosensitive ion channel [Tenacibaculum adriaticum]TYQ00428.1 mechanosensitive ion channel-like protein [Tenacibaculum adriaticum]